MLDSTRKSLKYDIGAAGSNPKSPWLSFFYSYDKQSRQDGLGNLALQPFSS
jgi:hypothetical protein